MRLCQLGAATNPHNSPLVVTALVILALVFLFVIQFFRFGSALNVDQVAALVEDELAFRLQLTLVCSELGFACFVLFFVFVFLFDSLPRRQTFTCCAATDAVLADCLIVVLVLVVCFFFASVISLVATLAYDSNGTSNRSSNPCHTHTHTHILTHAVVADWAD